MVVLSESIMKQIDEFILKDGRKVGIVLPSMKGLKAITNFINKLSKEDTFLSFAGEEYSLQMEKNWLKNALNEIKFKKNFIIWAIYDDPSTALGAGKIVGGCDIKVGRSRESHVGTLGLMVDKDFRGQGLGEQLLKMVLEHGKKMGLKIAKLNVFHDNIRARNLYKKIGLVEYGKLPNGMYRKGKYSDKIEMYKNL